MFLPGGREAYATDAQPIVSAEAARSHAISAATQNNDVLIVEARERLLEAALAQIENGTQLQARHYYRNR